MNIKPTIPAIRRTCSLISRGIHMATTKPKMVIVDDTPRTTTGKRRKGAKTRFAVMSKETGRKTKKGLTMEQAQVYLRKAGYTFDSKHRYWVKNGTKKTTKKNG